MYPPGYRPDGDDDCGCTFGQSCAWHAQKAEESRQATREDMKSRGIDPDAEISGDLLGLIMSIECSQSLSQHQKDRILAIISPVPR